MTESLDRTVDRLDVPRWACLRLVCGASTFGFTCGFRASFLSVSGLNTEETAFLLIPFLLGQARDKNGRQNSRRSVLRQAKDSEGGIIIHIRQHTPLLMRTTYLWIVFQHHDHRRNVHMINFCFFLMLISLLYPIDLSLVAHPAPKSNMSSFSCTNLMILL